MVAVTIGLVITIVGLVLTILAISAPIGSYMMVFGFLLIVRSKF